MLPGRHTTARLLRMLSQGRQSLSPASPLRRGAQCTWGQGGGARLGRGFASSGSKQGGVWGLWGAGTAGLASLGGLAVIAASSRPQEAHAEAQGMGSSQESYKHRVISNYENRIRAFSTPEKVFSHFASVTSEGEKFMTVEDFVCSLTLNAVRTKHTPDADTKASAAASRLFQLVDMNGDGLVSFHEYIFFMTIISIPENKFRVAFNMFDLDGNAELDQEEFHNMMEVLKSRSPSGRMSRSDVVSNSNAVRRNLEAKLLNERGKYTVLFGPRGTKTLTLQRFVHYLRNLQSDLLRLEFEAYTPDADETISARQFATALVSHVYPNQLRAFMQRLDDPEFPDGRVSWAEFMAFNKMLKSLHDIHSAIETFSITQKGKVDQRQMLHAVRAVAGVQLRAETLDIIFALFDKGGTGTIDHHAFFATMKLRKFHGTNRRREMDPFAFLGCCASCFSHFVQEDI